ncbi:TonB-dependent siderophore receptor [Acinetobacter corruptisaponis]|uniref:TonB-dependent siderophore receptor n=1 Tax=Acinetobacter corruptisaponis TaxID=3045147 RepID=A0ABY8S1U9_9GAMM|nr:TonB-dependent siderophore receptor [Acinetobacter sp. KCTC 92772]WHP05655.1 TonB-dependent siderophore receptor [Acinetobacter sp. KCTC 92772]
MSFIKSRKKIVSTAILSTLSAVANADNNATQLPTIDVKAEQTQGLKVDSSANTKYVAPLLDTPKSVSVISQQLIQDTQVVTLADALRTVPGITLGAGEGGNPNGDRPFIRGYNSEGSMYVDGIRSMGSQNREMFAVEQVEVTKGSSSSLGGGGNASGNINMVSKVAKKGDSIEGSVSQGTDDYRRIVLDGNKDFGNGIAARVVAMGHENNKAGQDNGAEYKRAGIAPSISIGLGTPTRATASYYYLRTNDEPDSGVPYSNPFGVTTANAKFNGDGSPINVKQGIYYGWKDRDFQKQENQIGTLKLEHDLLDNLTVSNIVTYSKSTNDYLWTQPDDSKGNFINLTTGALQDTGVWRRANSRSTDTTTYGDQLSLRGKFDTSILKHSFNAGAEYSKLDKDTASYTIKDPASSKVDGTLGTGACSLGLANANGWCTSTFNPNANDPFLGTITKNAPTSNTTTETTGIYFFDNIEIMPQLLLDVGVRWDKFETAVKTLATGVKIESDSDFWSYNAGVTFKPTENSAVYASYATSATPVGVDSGESAESSPSVAIKDLDPEKARTIEVGTKWNLLNNKLNATAAIFRTEKTNTRVAVDANTTMNAGSSKMDGFELGLSGNITDAWAISFGYSFLDSELVTAAYNAKANEGLPLANVPKNSATLWTTYQVLPQITVGGGATYMDKVYGAKSATAEKWVPDYVRYDAMARYNVNKNVDLQLNVNNLSNERYFTKAYGSHYAAEAEGRSGVLSLSFKY